MIDRHATPCWICGRVNSHDHTTAEWDAAEARALGGAWQGWLSEVQRIRSEAVAAERARVKTAVGDMPHNTWTTAQGRERVLRIIEGERPNEEDEWWFANR